MNHDVFISYSSQDKDAANAICHSLEQSGIRCWIAPRDIPGGSQYGDVIDKAIKSCKVVVVLFSQTAAVSPWVNGELNVAFEEQKTIIPFRLDQTPLQGQNRVMLNQKHWIDAYPDYKTKFNDLTNAVSLAIGKSLDPTIRTTATIVPRNKHSLLLWLGMLLAIVVLGGLLWFVTDNALKVKQFQYSYHQNGLNVETNLVTQDQAVVLTELLDNMVLIKGGSFMMGLSAKDSMYLTENDKLSLPSHKVTLNDFYISKYELTQKQWQMLFDFSNVTQDIGDTKPVDYLSWQSAQKFADSLSVLTSLGFSLPTEAQWEFAAKGGTLSANYLFSGTDDFYESGWLHDADASIHEVGEKKPNELGLYDMTGNVQELCKDFFSNYGSYSDVNPAGPATGKNIVVRGGNIYTSPFQAKNSSRSQCALSFNSRATGMRLVINMKQ